MKTLKILFGAMMLIAPILIAPMSAQAASQCNNTPWQQSNGRTCANSGLDSNRAVCAGGAYALYCDDTRTEIRTCASNVQCPAQQQVQQQPSFSLPTFNNQGFRYPQYNYGGRQQNNGASGNDYEIFRGKRFHCTEWDYKKKRPCKRDTFNEDCWGSCS